MKKNSGVQRRLGEGVKLVVLQSTAFCNISCRYCYLPHRNMKGHMSLKALEGCFSSIIENFEIQDDLIVLWHSGEPMVLGPGYYEEATQLISRLVGGRAKITFEMQTNATLLDEKWSNIYRRPDFKIGISVDGPKAVHDKNRSYRGGRGSHDRVSSAIDLLQAEGVDFSVICVLDDASLDTPRLYNDFFRGRGLYDVSFNIPNLEGVNECGLIDNRDTYERLYNFYRFFVRERLRGGDVIRIFQVDDMIRRVCSKKAASIKYDEHKAWTILTVGQDCTISTFSPELAGFSHPIHGSFTLGSLFPTVRLDVNRANSMQCEIEEGVKRCQSDCQYFEVCGGGLPTTKFFDEGAFHGSQHVSCVWSVQCLADAVAREVLELV
ncbi:MAG: radical SAM protein [Limimaricola soesokkakensis]|uniref:radical SAM protein n=1 Tax=Limimaricola soesokkakensis TaxID=1343159 RepID=UPI004057EF9E